MSIHKSMKLVLKLSVFLFFYAGIALGQPPSHDPTHMVKDGGRYWIFTTGTGIWNMSSDNADFSGWRSEPLVFSAGTWPSWINGYVPGFAGHFWAPEIIFMNGKWHLYYSCSTFGSQTSAIGLVTTPSISDSAWTDQGMVVHSPGSADVNAIDPAIYKDKDGKVWLLYGSFWDGIVITELDSTTGKPINPDNLHHAANNRCEAGYVISHGEYYYLFFNRGSCCSGIHSTYHILVGRSTSPTGPFYDKDSVATNNDGGSVFLHSDGRFIGPGHFGYGEDRLTYHYYDGLSQGDPRLKIASLEWEDDWPKAVYGRDGHFGEGNFVIANNLTGKVIQLQDADTIAGTNVAQYTETGDTSQHWSITYVDGTYYKISPVLSPDKSLEVLDCSLSSGANVQIGKYEGKACQQWYFANMGSYVFRIMSRNSFRALEVATGSSLDGTNVRQNSYRDDRLYQRWKFKVPTIISAVGSTIHEQEELLIHPNPSDGSFTIDLTDLDRNRLVHLDIYSIDGRLVYSNVYQNTNTIDVTNLLGSGIYQVNITDGKRVLTQKLMVK